MNAPRTSASLRIAAAIFAIVASTTTLGVTVWGLESGVTASSGLIAMDGVTVSAIKVN